MLLHLVHLLPGAAVQIQLEAAASDAMTSLASHFSDAITAFMASRLTAFIMTLQRLSVATTRYSAEPARRDLSHQRMRLSKSAT